MPKPLNQHVMTRAFRNGLTETYLDALGSIGVEPSRITVHIWGGATVNVTESDLQSIRDNAERGILQGYEEFSGHGNSGAIMIVLQDGLAYLEHNRPTLSAEDRKSSGGSRQPVNREEAERRKQRLEEMKRRLIDLHGIDLDAPNPDLMDDETDDDE